MIQKATKKDIRTLAELAVLLWENSSIDELINDFSEILSKEDAQIFLKYENDTSVGFAQCQLRHDYVEGTKTTPIGSSVLQKNFEIVLRCGIRDIK